MAKEFFKDTNFQQKSKVLLVTISEILNEYQAQGFDLSLRQLFYQLVARDFIANTVKMYNTIGKLVSNGRMAGLLDWSMIVDRGRKTERNAHWESPTEILRIMAEQFEIDKWVDQRNHIEVMVEKQALEGVLIPVCSELDVNFTANKGYASQSLFYQIGHRFRHIFSENPNKQFHVIYLGDHDPSGLDMVRDVEERIELFSGLRVYMHHVALKYDQVRELQLPENPAKLKDPRAQEYVDQFGFASWELDAVEPKQLAELVREAVIDLRDEKIWEEKIELEDEMKESLSDYADDYALENPEEDKDG